MKKLICCAAAFVAITFATPALRAIDVDQERERERQAEKVEKEQDLYDEANEAFDDHDWKNAARLFQRVAGMHMAHAGAALYWLAKSQSNLGQRSEALTTILELQKTYPRSKWSDDAKALELEVRQSAGQKIEPEHVEDEDLKLMAINGLMQTDPDRAVPILDRVLQTSKSAKLRERALFVLSQSPSSQAYEVLSRVARNSGDPDLQRRAVRYLGMMGSERNRKLLADLYASSSDVEIKKSVLKAYMLAGDRAHLLALAKGESNPDLRSEAVMQLGLVGGRAELAELYATESSFEVRKKILQAMFLGGNTEKLFDIARSEPNLELKLTAIRNLGLLGGGRAGEFLISLYQTDSREEVRKSVINSLFLQNNAKALVDLARRESNPELKKSIINKLSLMRSKEAVDYLMEYLKE